MTERPRSREVPRALAISTPRPKSLDAVRGWAIDLSEEIARTNAPAAIQLRLRGYSDRELFDLLQRLEPGRGRLPILVNGRVDLTVACGCLGAHLPSRGIPIAEARRLLGDGALLGVSTHSIEEIEAAAKAGADYVVFGPIFDTPSKRQYGPPLGLEALRRASARCATPILAIGGITAARFDEVADAGAHGVAAIRLFANPRDAASVLTRVGETFRG